VVSAPKFAMMSSSLVMARQRWNLFASRFYTRGRQKCLTGIRCNRNRRPSARISLEPSPRTVDNQRRGNPQKLRAIPSAKTESLYGSRYHSMHEV
jgi:hypothetical protein